MQLPGRSFVNPDDPVRDLFTDRAVKEVLAITCDGDSYRPIGRIVDEAAIVNAIVGLIGDRRVNQPHNSSCSYSGSGGNKYRLDRFLGFIESRASLASVYPNGHGDINRFEAAGGLAVVVSELLSAGLLHEDVETIVGRGLTHYAKSLVVREGELQWSDEPPVSVDHSILRSVVEPFSSEGGISVVEGNIGRAIVKVSALAEEHRSYITAPAKIFSSQDEFAKAFESGELNEDMVAVVKRQGPRANGMPELHKLSPYLGLMQNKGLKVALLTDGRMSGASGKILAAIQVTEATADGLIDRIQNGDMITIDSKNNKLEVGADLANRPPLKVATDEIGMGRELFAGLRSSVLSGKGCEHC